MKKRSIPGVPQPGQPRREFDTALKEGMEVLTGIRGTRVKPLDPGTATTADIVAKVNELLDLLQG